MRTAAAHQLPRRLTGAFGPWVTRTPLRSIRVAAPSPRLIHEGAYRVPLPGGRGTFSRASMKGRAVDDKDQRGPAPNWSFWIDLSKVELWQAVVLSLDREPGANITALTANEVPDSIADEYWRRLQIAKANAREVFPPLASLPISENRLLLERVSLATFGAWALTLSWEMPEDFPGMAQAQIQKYKLLNDLWDESGLQSLCCGLVPNRSRSATAELNEAGEAIRRAVLAGTLRVEREPSDATAGDRMYGHSRFFDPAEAARWAAPKFPKFPFKPEDFDTGDRSANGVTPRVAWLRGLYALLPAIIRDKGSHEVTVVHHRRTAAKPVHAHRHHCTAAFVTRWPAATPSPVIST